MPSELPKRRFVDEKGTTIITEGHSPVVLDVCYQNRTNYFLTVLKYTSKIFFFHVLCIARLKVLLAWVICHIKERCHSSGCTCKLNDHSLWMGKMNILLLCSVKKKIIILRRAKTKTSKKSLKCDSFCPEARKGTIWTSLEVPFSPMDCGPTHMGELWSKLCLDCR